MKKVNLKQISGNILIVDDDQSIRELIVCYLQESGYTLFEANNGQEGIEIFMQKRPDLVLTDLKMPVMNGLEFLKLLKKESPETPVIMISGEGEFDDTIEALRIGAVDYVLKPFNRAILMNAVIKAFEELKLMMKI